MGAPVTGPIHLAALGHGATVRFNGRFGPGLALRNEDGTWSATGMSTPLCSEELWGIADNLTVLSTGRVLERRA
ncbi:hypothetical protein [Arthrobacter caoxuetaonis]|uniref:Uncharacterized protein n=1 Tax=Arthrobacter caoxuetaonis TaxID=2886935 RepID=A0A9X1MGW0_9MICC|nr:hypothetical protein [Arthrobacter caoxuetaonis]MCC3299371.1 hypothetical protein [Arthrobacter caoxuetaonis]USQ59136.1 hypothetical protein NF551_18695 [Arthrobacter caoxuetaonis]